MILLLEIQASPFHQMINIWRTAHAFGRRVAYQYPMELCLSGTPLNETLVTLHQLIPQFQEKTGAEKVQCIILTDGEGSQLPYNKMVDRHWEEDEFLGCVPCHGDRSFLSLQASSISNSIFLP